MTQTHSPAASAATGPARTSVLVIPENELVRCGITSLLGTAPSVREIRACSEPVAETGPTSWSATAAGSPRPR